MKCLHVLVPGEYHCARCGKRLRFDGGSWLWRLVRRLKAVRS